jgi:hypothetical protein
MRIIRIPSIRGGDQDTVVLLLDRFHGWLFKVETSRVRDELRERNMCQEAAGTIGSPSFFHI